MNTGQGLKVGIFIPPNLSYFNLNDANDVKKMNEQLRLFRNITIRSSDRITSEDVKLGFGTDFHDDGGRRRTRRTETGKALLTYLQKQQETGCPIELLTIAGHGWGYGSTECDGGLGIPGHYGNAGFYADTYFNWLGWFWHKRAASISELKNKLKRKKSCLLTSAQFRFIPVALGKSLPEHWQGRPDVESLQPQVHVVN